jgi:hypothetical protein
VARCRQWPVLAIEVQAKDGLVYEAFSLVEFAIHNQGYGPARNLLIRMTNKEQFEGQAAQTRQIRLLRPGKQYREALDVRPQDFGSSVPLRFNLIYLDYQGREHSETHTIYLAVARSERDRQPSQVVHINTGGGAYIEGDVNTGGGDWVGRDQTGSSEHN